MYDFSLHGVVHAMPNPQNCPFCKINNRDLPISGNGQLIQLWLANVMKWTILLQSYGNLFPTHYPWYFILL